MENNEVNIAFEILLEEIEGVANALNEEGSKAFKEGNYEKAKALIEDAARLAEFRELVTGFIHEAETVLGVKANRIIFRRMKARWASCSAQGNITVNRLARVIPPELLRYIAFHEVAHLIHKNHGKGFRDLLSKVFPDHRTLERQLQQWWFVIQ